MDVKAYASAADIEAGKVGHQAYAESRQDLAKCGLSSSGMANVWPYRNGYFATRMNITAAIDRLDVRTMAEGELIEIDAAMRAAMSEAHLAVSAGDLVTESGEVDREHSENLCIQKLELAVAAGRDKLRLTQESRTLQWNVALLSAVLGFVVGLASGVVSWPF